MFFAADEISGERRVMTIDTRCVRFEIPFDYCVGLLASILVNANKEGKPKVLLVR